MRARDYELRTVEVGGGCCKLHCLFMTSGRDREKEKVGGGQLGYRAAVIVAFSGRTTGMNEYVEALRDCRALVFLPNYTKHRRLAQHAC